MWSGLVSSLTVDALATQITAFIGIPVVAAVILAVLGISLTIFAARKLMSAAPRR